MSVSLAGSITTLAAATGAGDSLNHNAFPGACLMPNGNHLVAWQHAYQHAGTPSKILVAEVNPTTRAIVTGPTTLYTCQSGWNAADPSCWTDGSDVYVLWNESSTPRLANINTVTNTLLAKSTNNGASFGSPVTVPIGFDSNAAGVAGAYGIAANPALVKSSGEWLLPVYGFDDKVALTGEYVKLRKTTNAGTSWTTVATITPPSGVTGFDETAIIEFDNGHRALIFRTFVTGGATHFYISRNDGTDDTTWTTPTLLLSNAGGRPALIQTSTGAVLMMYRYMVGGTVSGHTHLVWSLDRLETISSPVDPYDGAAGRTTSTGYTSPPPMGVSVYGAFAPAADPSPDAVLYFSEEDSTTDTRAVLMARSITTTNVTAAGYGNTTSSGYGDATAESAAGSLLVLPSSSAWKQVGTEIFVRTVNEPCSVEATVTGTAGGLLRFQGTDADLFDASLDGTTWASMVDIPPGTSTVYLRVTAEAPDTTLSAEVGVPV